MVPALKELVVSIGTFLLLALQAADDRVKQVAEVLAHRPRGPGAPGPSFESRDLKARHQKIHGILPKKIRENFQSTPTNIYPS